VLPAAAPPTGDAMTHAAAAGILPGDGPNVAAMTLKRIA